MKNKIFQMRIDNVTILYLDILAEHYNLSRSSVVCMLIAKEVRLMDYHLKINSNNDDKQ